MEFKMPKSREYVVALEEERRKIQVFQRELPLCFELVTRAIEAYRREISEATSDCSDQTSSGTPVLEEFIPLRRSSKVEDEEEDDRSSNKNSKKSDWLRSAQLWNQPSDLSPIKEDVPRIADGGNGAFQPFQRVKEGYEKNEALCVATSARSSSAETVASGGGENRKKERESGGQRKQRRCWSSELHRRFLNALQQLGGSHVATPKQIRELMKVDGLTNDEVKSHLQKYRLHTRRPTPAIHAAGASQPPQFVVVGGIWVPPPEYVAGEPANEIYAPVAAPPPLPKAAASALEKKSDVSGGGSSEEDAGHGGSTSTASSNRKSSSPVH